nr:hypothetical protein [Marinibactrum halimedae]
MLKLLVKIALLFGRSFTKVILAGTATYFLWFGGEAKQHSKQFLQKILPRPIHWKDIWQHFYAFAQVSVDRLYFLSGRLKQFHVEVIGEDIIRQHIESQQGGLLFIAHIGSFDALRACGESQQRFPLSILLDKQHNQTAMELINTLNPAMAEQIIDARLPAPELALTINERLQKGQLIGIMADRAASGDKTLPCHFLGAQTMLPQGPWQLALMLKTPVIMCTGLFLGKNRYQLHFQTLWDGSPVPRKERASKLTELIQHYANQLEHYVKLAPYNWFNFYDFWSNDSSQNH